MLRGRLISSLKHYCPPRTRIGLSRCRRLNKIYLTFAMLTCTIFALNKLLFTKNFRVPVYDHIQGPLLQIYNTMQWFNNYTSFRRSFLTKTLYPHDFGIMYNESSIGICPKGIHISILFMVHTALGNFKERIHIRNTFTNRTYFPDHEIRTIFLVGTTDDNQTQLQIETEQTTYGDIVQGYFQDTYHNLTLKVVTGLKWITNHCPNVSLVAKIDDDTFVQTFKILENILSRYKYKHIFCNMWPKGVMGIARAGKWKVADDQLKRYNGFPWRYCSGFAVIMTGDLIPLLYKASLSSPYFWVDDVYFSGILASRIENLQYTNVPLGNQSSISESFTFDCFKTRNCSILFSSSRNSNIHDLWKMVLENRRNGSHMITPSSKISVDNSISE